MLERKFRAIPGIDYLSGDLFDPGAMERIDITDIRFPDDSFDLILCSHVLEHVPDDRKAISELFRVLKPGGTAFLLVPIGSARTFEDPSVTDPDERLRFFGQKDHVRQYGPDFEDRLVEAGFRVTRVESPEMLSPRQIKRLSVRPEFAFPIFACTKELGS